MILVPMVFNAAYSYKEFIPRWTKPYIDTRVLDYITTINEKICLRNNYIVYVIYIPKYNYWEFAVAWLYRNWLYALTDCKALVYYGQVSDLLKNINSLSYRTFSEKVYKDYHDVIVNLKETNSEVLGILNSTKGVPIVIIKPLYQGNDLDMLNSLNHPCLVTTEQENFMNSSLIICYYSNHSS